MTAAARILMTRFVTHDVKAFVLDKPEGFAFAPGQAVMVSINRPGLAEERRPFSPTSLNEDRVVQFIIKRYPEHRGVTEKLHQLGPGDELLIGPVRGEIQYKGPGVFVAASTGVTPFLAILRQLQRDGRLAGHSLLLSNRRHEDIIVEPELRSLLGERCVLTLTREERPGYEHWRIDKAFLRDKVADFTQRFYVCGPSPFVNDVTAALAQLGAQPSQLVFD